MDLSSEEAVGEALYEICRIAEQNGVGCGARA